MENWFAFEVEILNQRKAQSVSCNSQSGKVKRNSFRRFQQQPLGRDKMCQRISFGKGNHRE